MTTNDDKTTPEIETQIHMERRFSSGGEAYLDITIYRDQPITPKDYELIQTFIDHFIGEIETGEV